MGAVAMGRVFGLAAGAEVEGLAGLSVDLVGGGLPTHRMIIQQSLEKESGTWGQVAGGRGCQFKIKLKLKWSGRLKRGVRLFR